MMCRVPSGLGEELQWARNSERDGDSHELL